MATESEPRPTITKVWAKNFRSIEYAELELGPLTVLVGPNASGKSNLLDVLGFLADAARLGLEAAITRRGGIGSIGRRSPDGRVLAPEIGFQVELGKGTLEYSVSLMTRGNVGYRVKREYAKLEPTTSRPAPCEIEVVNGRLIKPDLNQIARNSESTSPDLVRAFNRIIKEETGPLNPNLLSERVAEYGLLIALADTVTEPVENNSYVNLGFVLNTARIFWGEISVYHIFPNSLRAPQKMAESHPLAAGGENLASTLRDMILNKNRFLPDLKHGMNYAAPDIRDVRVKKAGSYYVVELYHKTDPDGKRGVWLDLSYESDGAIRMLAMLAAIFQEPSPSLICLEEPEMALHPGAMIVLAEDLKEAALRGQVVVATHSPDLINLLPLDSIRAVTAEGGSTKVGKVAEHQLKSVRDNLFLPGELHSMEGLQPAGAGNPTE